jgi:hypothetical protein
LAVVRFICTFTAHFCPYLYYYVDQYKQLNRPQILLSSFARCTCNPPLLYATIRAQSYIFMLFVIYITKKIKINSYFTLEGEEHRGIKYCIRTNASLRVVLFLSSVDDYTSQTTMHVTKEYQSLACIKASARSAALSVTPMLSRSITISSYSRLIAFFKAWQR